MAEAMAGEASQVRYTLGPLEVRPGALRVRRCAGSLPGPQADVRRQALALLRTGRRSRIGSTTVEMLKDADLGADPALLYLDPGRCTSIRCRRFEKLGDFEGISFARDRGLPGVTRQPQYPTQRALLGRWFERLGRRRPQHARAAPAHGLRASTLLDFSTLVSDDGRARTIRSATSRPRQHRLGGGASTTSKPSTSSPLRWRATAITSSPTSGGVCATRTPQDIRHKPHRPHRQREAERVADRQLLPGRRWCCAPSLIASLDKLRDTLHALEVNLDFIDDRPAAVAADRQPVAFRPEFFGPLEQRLPSEPCPSDTSRDGPGSPIDLPLMGLLLPHVGLHDAYVGLRDPATSIANRWSLDNMLDQELRRLHAAA